MVNQVDDVINGRRHCQLKYFCKKIYKQLYCYFIFFLYKIIYKSSSVVKISMRNVEPISYSK